MQQFAWSFSFQNKNIQPPTGHTVAASLQMACASDQWVITGEREEGEEFTVSFTLYLLPV